MADLAHNRTEKFEYLRIRKAEKSQPILKFDTVLCLKSFDHLRSYLLLRKNNNKQRKTGCYPKIQAEWVRCVTRNRVKILEPRIPFIYEAAK